MISTPFSTHRRFQQIPFVDFVVFWKSDFHIVFNTTELSINSLVYFVVLWERRVGRKPARGLGWQQVRARARYKFKV